MAKRGCSGVIKFGTTAIAEVRSISINESGTETDTSVLGNCATKSEVTSVTTTVDVEVFYAPSDTVQDSMSIGAKAALEIYPEGETTGLDYMSSSEAIVLSRTTAINHGDMISRTLSLKCNDGLTEAVVA
jgi:hypothetical protein